MPGCVLRVWGEDFDVDAFLSESPWEPTVVRRRGERRFGGAKVRSSGFNVLVSDASGAEFERQLEDAERFLADHAPEFERLAATGGADEPWLDFGIERARLPRGGGEYFPASFLALAAETGVAVAVSSYPRTHGYLGQILSWLRDRSGRRGSEVR